MKAILIGAALMLSLSMGLRQSLGLLLPPLTKDLAIAVSDFTIAIAVQNIAWGVLQPIAGAVAARVGFRPLMLAGACFYLAGLLTLAMAQGVVGVTIGAGVFVGAALACNGSAIALAVASRAVPVAVRSSMLGLVTAFGSLGSVLAAPVGQMLADGYGWRAGAVGFAVIALGLLPAAWMAGRVDRVALPTGGHEPSASAGAALKAAFGNGPFLLMATAYFVCGMQLVFILTHLPSYLALCGMDPMLSAKSLAVIGVFNVLGSLFFGWAGGRWSKQMLLGSIYVSRSIVLGLYFYWPPSAEGTLVFAAIMGFLWMGVGPLIAGSVAETFGLRWQAMIQGIAFTSHQLGSFVGALGGGLLFDALGSYDLAWKLGVGLGLTMGVLQIAFASKPPSRHPPKLDSAMAAG